MTPQHEDAAVQGGQVFAEEVDPGKVFFGGVSLKAEKITDLEKKACVSFF